MSLGSFLGQIQDKTHDSEGKTLRVFMTRPRRDSARPSWSCRPAARDIRCTSHRSLRPQRQDGLAARGYPENYTLSSQLQGYGIAPQIEVFCKDKKNKLWGWGDMDVALVPPIFGEFK